MSDRIRCGNIGDDQHEIELEPDRVADRDTGAGACARAGAGVREFSDRPFAAGSLFGIRSFRVGDSGVLTGCVQRLPWHSGVNEAGCYRPSVLSFSQAMQAIGASAAEAAFAFAELSAALSGRVLLTKQPKRRPPPPPPPSAMPVHDVGSLGCTCGFYAYFDLDHNPHHRDGNVLGIVEGFGIVTVGSRGFRASKARIKALIGQPCVLDPQYDDIPWFPSVEDALAEFPLTPVERPDADPLPEVVYGHATFTIIGGSRLWSRLFGVYAGPKPEQPPADETPQERALRLRRERNTGPADQHGLDGHHRRKR